MLGIQNGRIKFRDTDMDYIRFGTGEKTLIMLPGLGDGLRTIRGMALPFALMYHSLGRDYTVYSFSRKNHMPEGYTTRDMARDVKWAMDGLGIRQADVFGVSMGGMIAQHLAIDYREQIGALVLAVTAARPNPILNAAVDEWMEQALRDDHTALMDSNVRLIYSDGYYRRNRWMVPIMGKLTKPASYERFLIMAQACKHHDAFDRLKEIRSRTLIIGGGKDRSLGIRASYEIAGQIPGCELLVYEQWGHGVYEEEKTFFPRVLEFLNRMD